MISFDGKILLIGYGAVSMCTLPMLLDHIGVSCGNITIMDFENKREALKAWMERGIKFVEQKLTPENIESTLSGLLSTGDMVILTSDGVAEATSSTDDLFGFERLEAAITNAPITSAQAMLDHLKAEIATFVGDVEPYDDITIVVLQV